MYTQFDTRLGTPGNTQVFDPVAELFRVADIVTRNVAYALCVNLVKLQGYTESQRTQDRHWQSDGESGHAGDAIENDRDQRPDDRHL